ncbi:hypothetical protein GCM10009747_35030 [Agromyces humatus]|uniref:Uncharacterized protein n=1 Tax=Agromyces humatus TaxID=279573 RepID=A0ABP4X952_9MICO
MKDRPDTPTAGVSGDAESQVGPVFVDPSGRRRRRARIIGGLALCAVAGYLGLVATVFLGGPDVVTPLLPKPAAANEAARELPAVQPTPSAAPSVVPDATAEPTPAAPDLVAPQPAAAAPTPAEPAPTEPAADEPAADEPGKSETAPGKTNTPEHPQRP